MRFSIVVPVFNIEKYIKECIESILDQNFKDYELILIDDGSKDKSGKICDEYSLKDDRIIVIHKENGGLVSARKEGINIAKGEYLVNIDGDDFIKKDYLNKINKFIINYNPDIVAVGCTWWTPNEKTILANTLKDGFYIKNDLISIRNYIISDIDKRKISFGGLLYSSWSKITKLSLVKPIQNDIPNDITIGEDFAVTVQLLFNCKSLVIASSICDYCYRKNENSMINTWKESEFSNEVLLFQYMDRVLKKDDNEKMNRYIYLITVRYIIGAANNSTSYKMFKHLLENKIPSTLFLRFENIQAIYWKDVVLLKLIVNRKYLLLYLYYRFLRRCDCIG